jgi:RIO kinase 1
MVDPLEPLLADGVIDEVVARLKSGKEADLWLVRHGQEVVAAKVYKAREARSFKNNSAYLEGRRVRNTRTQRAMDRGSRFGQAAAEEAWKTREADALHALHAAGVRVPKPVLFYEGVLLMEVVVDAAGRPAPRLIDAAVAPEQAAGLYAGLRAEVVRMLCCDLVHGDLSPYNVLLGWDGPVIIDFPQVVGAAHNSQAEGFFFRDLANLRHFFEALDPSLRAMAGDGREIWRAYTRRELTPDFVPPPPRPGAPPPPEPRPEPRPGPPRGRPGRGAPHRPPPPPQQQPPRPAPERPQPQQQRARQAQRPQPQAHPRPGAQAQPSPRQAPSPRRPGGGGQPPRGPIVERRPVLGAPAAQVAPRPPSAEPLASAAPAQGRRRRRRRGRRGGGQGPAPA